MFKRIMIVVGTAVIYSILFLWGERSPKAKRMAEALAVAGMLYAFFNMVSDVPWRFNNL
ncbi:MAG: hypothetical protein FGF53_08575 [Candidatus Brockarchaeota archaeon]|nr:hypothetical protein [Candidatus Brockarchaeota archaeon]